MTRRLRTVVLHINGEVLYVFLVICFCARGHANAWTTTTMIFFSKTVQKNVLDSFRNWSWIPTCRLCCFLMVVDYAHESREACAVVLQTFFCTVRKHYLHYMVMEDPSWWWGLEVICRNLYLRRSAHAVKYISKRRVLFSFQNSCSRFKA